MSDLELAAYFDGRLAGEAREAVERHLSAHGECREAAGIMREVLARRTGTFEPGEAPEALIEKVIHLYRQRDEALDAVLSIARSVLSIIRVSPGTTLVPALTASPLRAGEAKNPSVAVITKEFGPVLVEVAVERLANRKCNFIVMARDRASGTPLRNVRAELVTGGREIASCLLSRGEGLFEDVGPGRHAVMVKQGGALCGRIIVEIRE